MLLGQGVAAWMDAWCRLFVEGAVVALDLAALCTAPDYRERTWFGTRKRLDLREMRLLSPCHHST